MTTNINAANSFNSQQGKVRTTFCVFDLLYNIYIELSTKNVDILQKIESSLVTAQKSAIDTEEIFADFGTKCDID